jgi:hypothetical protein
MEMRIDPRQDADLYRVAPKVCLINNEENNCHRGVRLYRHKSD